MCVMAQEILFRSNGSHLSAMSVNFTQILPLELLLEILSYVEAESLLIFRRVSQACKFLVDNFHKFECFICDEKSNKPWTSQSLITSLAATSSDYYKSLKSLLIPSSSSVNDVPDMEPANPFPCFYDSISTLHIGNLKENSTLNLKPIRKHIRKLNFYGRISFDNLDRILSQCDEVETINFTGEALCGLSPSSGFFSRKTLRYFPLTGYSSVFDDPDHEFESLHKVRIILDESTRGGDGRPQNQNPYNAQTFSTLLRKFEGQNNLQTFVLRSNAGVQNTHLLQMLSTNWHHIFGIIAGNTHNLNKLILSGISIPAFDFNNPQHRRDWTETFCALNLEHLEIYVVRGHLSTRIRFLRFIQSQKRLQVFSVLSNELNFSLLVLQELLQRNPDLIKVITPVTTNNLTNAIKMFEDVRKSRQISYQLHHNPRL